MIFILGPTASGKSALAIALAETLAHQLSQSRTVKQTCEIISIDSALVFKHMDIGTAKPTPAERQQVTHHLIDLIEPTESYSAAQFASDARAAHEAIAAKGNLPLLVGGTMLYVSALSQGLSDLPKADPAIRDALNAEATKLGWPAMHARLAQLDASTAARLQPTDAQRIQRALEVIEITGQKLSDLQTRTQKITQHRSDNNLFISLEPSDRLALHRRIEQRLKQMFDRGFIDEVRQLKARGDLEPSMPSMRCVGYRQIWQALDDSPCASNEAIFKASFHLALVATRQLCKRQLTWLRANPERMQFDCLLPTQALLQPVAAAIEAHLALQWHNKNNS